MGSAREMTTYRIQQHNDMSRTMKYNNQNTIKNEL